MLLISRKPTADTKTKVFSSLLLLLLQTDKNNSSAAIKISFRQILLWVYASSYLWIFLTSTNPHKLSLRCFTWMPQTISRSRMWQQSLENPFISLLISSSFSSGSARHTCRSTLTTGYSSNLSNFLLQFSAATYLFRSLGSFYHGTILASIPALSWLHPISLRSQASKHSTYSTGECGEQLTTTHIVTSVWVEV